MSTAAPKQGSTMSPEAVSLFRHTLLVSEEFSICGNCCENYLQDDDRLPCVGCGVKFLFCSVGYDVEVMDTEATLLAKWLPNLEFIGVHSGMPGFLSITKPRFECYIR